MLKMAAGAADMMQGRIHWRIEARLDVPYIELHTTAEVNLNLRE